MAWNASLIGLVAFFIKKWINNIESSTKNAAVELIKVAKELRLETAATATVLANETLKEATSLNNKIDRIFNELRDANGRTGKLETAVCVQKALCEEKHKKCPPREEDNKEGGTNV
jgi:hypothetical protein